MDKIIIFTDGASRGNPGPASIGVLIADSHGVAQKEYSQTIGKATNNEAEYQAVIFALKKVKALVGKAKIKNAEILIKSDSELMVSQLSGKYKIKEPNIQKLFIQAWNLKIDYKKVDFQLVPREQNSLADKLANHALDAESQKLF
ncbi:ribonuclease HI family protein [Patescibacteria group bacterium]|nr:ribonuclease HI family protein [Patescibacteria group bacterium]MBU4161986.1 ribonuclease HI family protein [Patescibacteria group bacterium]